MGKSSKEKVMGLLSECEKNSRNVSMSINIQTKDIDGEMKRVYSFERYGPIEVGGSSPVPKEYTNKDDFMKYISEFIDKVETQI
jgi:hypothetical protein